VAHSITAQHRNAKEHRAPLECVSIKMIAVHTQSRDIHLVETRELATRGRDEKTFGVPNNPDPVPFRTYGTGRRKTICTQRLDSDVIK
jgi:hypothetical protein